jgi:integrase
MHSGIFLTKKMPVDWPGRIRLHLRVSWESGSVNTPTASAPSRSSNGTDNSPNTSTHISVPSSCKTSRLFRWSVLGRDRKTKKTRPLSAKTVHHIAGVVNSALSTAVRWKLIKSNPMDAVVLPKVAKKEARALDPSQLTWYMNAVHACGLYEFLMIDAATGCRRGELLALTWPDVSFHSRVVSISKSLEQTKAGLRVKPTKTERPRQISIPQSAIEILKIIQATQEHNRSMFGADYRRDLDLVFCGPDGSYLKPDSVSSKCSLIAKQAGLKSVSLHTLRHSHGSLLLSAGVPLPVVSKRLGHSSPHVTAMVYSHALPKDEEAAAEIWDSAFRMDNGKEKDKPVQ